MISQLQTQSNGVVVLHDFHRNMAEAAGITPAAKVAADKGCRRAYPRANRPIGCGSFFPQLAGLGRSAIAQHYAI